ncbi:Fe(3+)-hydroxamate ABC transporter permease FhuB [Bosea sp. TAB14]|jgi:iron complex transport system permease protein|uniref:Fe(3+)-hydroxamate ABC transporter permease FhuB n=1 Tax=Bosea sp. TAB14 TaxID=3237481 RepID=UPI003F903D2F
MISADSSPMRPWRLALPLLTAAFALSLWTLAVRLPPPQWPALLKADAGGDINILVLQQSLLPRMAVSLLCGAALGLAGTIFQQVLRNPLASPMTLGVAAGAKLALGLATVMGAPLLSSVGRDGIAFAGGALAMAATIALAWRRGLSPLALVLGGLVLGLYCGALSALLLLFKEHDLQGLFLWGNGSLAQQGWDVALALALRLVVLAGLAVLLLRPLALLALNDDGVRGLGLSLLFARLGALGVAVALSTVVVSLVGVIGFIGLIAPALARLGGARRIDQQMLWAPIIGAALLWLTDQAVLQLGAGTTLPTGAITALFGAPVLLWMLPRLRTTFAQASNAPRSEPRARSAALVLAGLGLALTAVLALALTFGRTPSGGWSFAWGDGLAALLPWRFPGVVAALAAGAMLGVAGAILQRLLRNPMASPEVLGISSGAAFGLIVALFVLPAVGRHQQLFAATAGAAAILGLILVLGRKTGFSPERILLAGIALGAMLDAVVGALLAGGDPRAMLLMSWMTGSTYAVDEVQMVWAAATAILLLASVPLLLRWLELVGLGDAAGRSLGLTLPLVRLFLLLLSAALTAAGTLVIGPLTFVGLMTPHLARLLGLQRAASQLAASALAGALVMVAADWLGRVAAFPWQMPAGLIATLIGGPVLIALLARK